LGGIVLGFAWRMPEGESLESYFNFYHYQNTPNSSKPMLSEILHEEKILLSEESPVSKTSSVIDLIKFRELEKDWNLSELSLIIEEYLSYSKYLKCPPAHHLMPSSIINLLERFYEVRAKLVETLGE